MTVRFKNGHMLFKVPGAVKHEGMTYDFIVVEAEDVPAKVAEGWSGSLVDAKAKAPPPAPPPPAPPAPLEPSDDAPPTRAELEEQCKKLGLKVDGRYSDRRLLSMIEDAMR